MRTPAMSNFIVGDFFGFRLDRILVLYMMTTLLEMKCIELFKLSQQLWKKSEEKKSERYLIH